MESGASVPAVDSLESLTLDCTLCSDCEGRCHGGVEWIRCCFFLSGSCMLSGINSLDFPADP